MTAPPVRPPRRAFATTEATHLADGTKSASQVRREEDAWRDAQPMTSTCGVHGCDSGPDGGPWSMTGPSGEVRVAFFEHRASVHPTAGRAIRGRQRLDGGLRDDEAERVRHEAAAEQRRQEIARRDPPAPPVDVEKQEEGEPPPLPRTWSRKAKTADEVLAAIRACAETIGRSPSARDMTEHGSVSTKAAERLFGSWPDAVRAAGLEPRVGNEGPRTAPAWTRERAIERLQAVAAELGRTPSRQPGLPGMAAAVRLFGSWAAYCQAAGLEPPQMGPRPRTAAPALPEREPMAREASDTALPAGPTADAAPTAENESPGDTLGGRAGSRSENAGASLAARLVRIDVETIEEIARTSMHADRLRDTAASLRAIADWLEGDA